MSTLRPPLFSSDGSSSDGPNGGLPGEPDDRLCRILADFLTRSDAGEPVDREALLADHAEYAAELSEFFEVSDQLKSLGDEQGGATLVLPPPHERLMNPVDGELPPGDGDTFGEAATLNIPPPNKARDGAPPGGTLNFSPGSTIDVPFPHNAQNSEMLRSFRLSRDAETINRTREAAVRRAFGDYEILEEIAQGGMGVVYKARQRRLNRIVALKMILSGQFANSSEVERFYVEAEAAANLRHPNIVAVYEVGEVEGRHFFSMDFIEGKSLLDLVRRQPLEPRHAADLVKKIAETVAFAHCKGVIHRDLKPSNVLLDHRGEPMITDFGLAKRTDGDASQLTMTGTIIGSPSYMPPEQARGGDVGTAADVYSTGAVLYELLTASPPFSAANPFDTVKQVLDVEPASPRLRNPSVPRDLETICLKCLQKEPTRRYASAEALAEELGRFLEGRPILARPVGPIEKTVRWCKRNKAIAGMLGVLATSVIVFVIGLAAALIMTLAARERDRETLALSRLALNDLFIVVSENELLNQPNAQELRKTILVKARNIYELLLERHEDNPELRGDYAVSNFYYARIVQEVDSSQKALEPLSKARTILEAILADEPDNVEALDALGDTLNAIGKSYEKLRRHAEAEAAYNEAIAAREQLVELAPDDEHSRKLVNAYMNLAIVEKERGDNAATDEAAAPFYQAAHEQFVNAQNERRKHLARSAHNPLLRLDLARGCYNLGNLAFQMNLKTEAVAYLQEAAEEFDWLIDQAPADLEYQYLHAQTISRLGAVHIFTDDADIAHTHFQEATERLRVLAAGNPDVHKYALSLANTLSNRGFLYTLFGQTTKAIDCYHQALETLRRLVQENAEPLHRRELGKTLCDLAQQQIAVGEMEDARANLEEAKTILAELAADYHQSQDFAMQLARAEELLAEVDGK